MQQILRVPRGPRVILFEDEEIGGEELATLLRRRRIDVVTLATASQAQQALSTSSFDGGIFDILERPTLRPVGLDLCERFVQKHAGAPAFAVSGDNQYRPAVEQMGVRYISKPLKPERDVDQICNEIWAHFLCKHGIIEATVEYQTETTITVSFEHPDVGLVLFDILKSREEIPANIEIGDSIGLRRLASDKREVAFSLVSQEVWTLCKPTRAPEESRDYDSLLPSEPEDYDDPEQVQRYLEDLDKYFQE